MQKIKIMLFFIAICGLSPSFSAEILSLSSSNFYGITGIRDWYPGRMIDGSIQGDDTAGVSAYANLGDTFYYEFAQEMSISRVTMARREGQPTSKWYITLLNAAGVQTYYYEVLDNNARLANILVMDTSFSAVSTKKIIFGHIQVTNSNDRATWSEVQIYGSSLPVPEPSSMLLMGFWILLRAYTKNNFRRKL